MSLSYKRVQNYTVAVESPVTVAMQRLQCPDSDSDSHKGPSANNHTLNSLMYQNPQTNEGHLTSGPLWEFDTQTNKFVLKSWYLPETV